MPGKVNPVIAESTIQVCLWVIGADLTITLGGLQSFFELNVGMPLIAAQMLESVHLLATSSRNFADACIAGIEADRERCESLVEQSLAMCTPLAPVIGYDKAAEIAKTACSGRQDSPPSGPREIRFERQGTRRDFQLLRPPDRTWHPQQGRGVKDCVTP